MHKKSEEIYFNPTATVNFLALFYVLYFTITMESAQENTSSANLL